MATVARVRIIDEVYVNISGIHPSDNDYLYKKYGIFSKGYFFNPRYTMGAWDGKIRFYQDTGTTYLYLIEEILEYLGNQGYKIELTDNRTAAVPEIGEITADIFSHRLHPKTGEPIVLRSYQVEAGNSVVYPGYGIVKAATGAGKTLITAAISKVFGDAGVRAITIVPDLGLIKQTKEWYEICGLDVGEYSGDEKTLDKTHIVSTWQALSKNPHVIQLFGCVIVDECHGAKGNVLRDLIIKHGANIPFRVGVTGTLPPDEVDALTVTCAIGPLRYEIPAHDLIEAGVLAEINVEVIQIEENFQKEYAEFVEEWNASNTLKPPTYVQFKDGYFGDYSAEKSYLHRNDDRISLIAEIISEAADQKKGNLLCLVDSIPFGRQLAEAVPGSIFVNGQDVKKAKERKKIFAMFEEHDDLCVIATTHIASTGIDAPRIFTVVLVDPGKSFIRVMQSIGRGLRKAADKDKVRVVDIASDLKYGKKHLAARLKFYREAGYPYKKYKLKYIKHEQQELY